MTAPHGAGFDAVVLAGGVASRLGGRDKMLEVVGGIRLIDRALTAAADAGRVIAVGDEREATAAALWVREQPPGGGPVAALAAGLELVDAERVVLLAGDLPFVDRRHVTALVGALNESDAAGAMFVDPDGRDQPLLSAWWTASLRKVLPDQPAGAGLRRMLAPLEALRLPGEADLMDCDTETDLAAARARADGGERST